MQAFKRIFGLDLQVKGTEGAGQLIFIFNCLWNFSCVAVPNVCKNVQKKIQMVLKWLFFSKLTKIA